MFNAIRGRHKKPPILTSLFIAILAAGLSPAGALAQDKKPSDIEARYQAERAACEKAPPSQDREACLREAAAARAEARHGQLNGDQPNYDKNALARCDALPAEEQDVCRRRARNEGETRGSVSEGGIYREYREITLPPATPNGKP
ncbi:MAG TPA: hypothetical protein VJ698_13100 [Noviherbaspirillum sp.]|uniref:hypothetical protein n=1 Tax=Noviherbaspirillum sp. TaxID=1926288 RepID=UPI002B45B5FC|nr:hypothetical protein [Noviherbaspirillum sp.]HJV86405.1 hypothetical protein [Noviherbaspirillum sp.]